MQVESLWVYPVKSLQGISLDEAAVVERGFQFDRHWMLVDPTGAFVTQRKDPRLARFATQLMGSTVIITAPSGATLEVHADQQVTSPRTVTVWRDTFVADDVGDEAAAFFSTHLARPLRLVAMREQTRRTLDPKYAPDALAHTGFADAYPLLVANLSSLDELNSRLKMPVPMNRFRPNIILRAPEPWAEDGWRALRIGALELAAVKPCSRCVMITTDQTTGVVAKEPLEVLASYRTTELGAIFGMNAVHRSTGTLRVGDSVSILQ